MVPTFPKLEELSIDESETTIENEDFKSDILAGFKEWRNTPRKPLSTCLKEKLESHHGTISPETLVWALRVIRNVDLSMAISNWGISQPDFKPTTSFFNSVLNKCSLLRNEHVFLKYLDIMESYGCEKDESTLNCIVGTLAKSGNLEKTEAFLKDLKSEGYKMYNKTAMWYIQALGKVGKSDEALKVFNVMRENRENLDKINYNVMMDILGKAGRLEEMVQKFEEMKKEGFQPDSVSYNTLINNYVRAEKFSEAEALFNYMNDGEEVKPDKVTYTAIMTGLGFEKRVEGVLDLFEEMEEKGIWRDVVVYSIVMEALAASGDLDAALKMFEKMKKENVTVQTMNFNKLIAVLLRTGKEDEVPLVLSELEKSNVKKNVITFEVMMDYSKAIGDPQIAIEAYKEMKLKGIKPNYPVMSKLIYILEKYDKQTEANECREEAEKSDLAVGPREINKPEFLGDSNRN